MKHTNSRSSTLSWAMVEVGQELQLLENGRQQFAGRVDAVTHGQDIIWLTTPPNSSPPYPDHPASPSTSRSNSLRSSK